MNDIFYFVRCTDSNGVVTEWGDEELCLMEELFNQETDPGFSVLHCNDWARIDLIKGRPPWSESDDFTEEVLKSFVFPAGANKPV